MNRNNEIRLTELDAARLERSLIEQLRRGDAPTHGTAALEALLDLVRASARRSRSWSRTTRRASCELRS